MAVNSKKKKQGRSRMITDSFDERTMANMEVALERACQRISDISCQHEARRYIASKILQCAESGDRTLHGLTQAGNRAAADLSVTIAA